MLEKKSSYSVLVGKPVGKSVRWEDNIKIDLNVIG
jgi:hypothetical protein